MLIVASFVHTFFCAYLHIYLFIKNKIKGQYFRLVSILSLILFDVLGDLAVNTVGARWDLENEIAPGLGVLWVSFRVNLKI